MNIRAALVLLPTMLLAGGCVVIHPKAETVLTFRRESCDEAVPVGFAETKWAPDGGGIKLVGYGWHPREHENYAYFLSEPNPVFNPCWLIVESAEGGGSIRVVWPNGHAPFGTNRVEELSGRLSGIRATPGRTLKLTLRDVWMSSRGGEIRVLMSGRIRAVPVAAKSDLPCALANPGSSGDVR